MFVYINLMEIDGAEYAQVQVVSRNNYQYHDYDVMLHMGEDEITVFKNRSNRALTDAYLNTLTAAMTNFMEVWLTRLKKQLPIMTKMSNGHPIYSRPHIHTAACSDPDNPCGFRFTLPPEK